MAVVSNMATWLVIIRDKKSIGKAKVGDNCNGLKPGTARVCIEHGEKLAVLETKQSNIEKCIGEIKDDIKVIREAVTNG